MGQAMAVTESGSTGAIRFLLPVDATDRSLWAVSYVLRMAQQAPRQPEVVLLFVAPPVRNWEVLKFRTESEIHQFFQERAEIFLSQAAGPLLAAGIRVYRVFREVEPVHGIPAIAEELGCSEIVMPKPECWGLFSSRLPFKVRREAHGTPVTLVSPEGMPQH